MSDPNSLVATRAKRANAGSRLKHLIQIEELASEAHSFAMTEDDENVELLFQEDANDEEFNEDDEEEDDDQEEEENTDEENDEDASRPANGSQPKKDTTSSTPGQEDSTSETEQNFNDDEMLSDSDLSASDNDDSEGERELERQERADKRKRKPASIIPVIKKPKPEAPKPVAKPLVKHSDLLLMSERRSSSRKSALKNKEQLINRIKQDEKRRAALTPIVRVKERKLTQEERLAQAVETERENIESLHLFMEQEIVKKERQKWLLQLRRPKLRNVIRFVSEETFVCPLDEVEDDRHVQDLYERRRKGKRRRFNEYPEERRLGDIDTELPYYRKEMEEKRVRELRLAEERRILEEARAIKRKRLEEEREARRKALEEERVARKTAKEERLKEFENVDITSADISQNTCVTAKSEELDKDKICQDVLMSVETTMETEELPKADDYVKIEDQRPTDHELLVKNSPKDDAKQIQTGPEAQDPEVQDPEVQDPEVQNHEVQNLEVQDPENISLKKLEPNSPLIDELRIDFGAAVPPTLPNETTANLAIDTSMSATEIKSPEPTDEATEDIEMKEPLAEPQDAIQIEEEKMEADTSQNVTPALESNVESATETEKKVTFEVEEEPREVATELEQEYLQQSLNEYFYRKSEDGTIFEGPVQHVGRNHVMLLDFDDDNKWGLTEVKIKTVLFGEDAALTGPRRLRDVETILRSTSRLDNPYAAPKEEKEDEMFKPVTEITEEDAMFEILKRVPRLGDKNVYTLEVDEENNEEATQIRIHTEAPSGLHLPNGNKKLCFISGKEVRYFDPITGIPYENKDMYKIIKDVELGLYSWHSIGRDINAYGSAQIYLNKREGARHAQGVPDGFDG